MKYVLALLAAFALSAGLSYFYLIGKVGFRSEFIDELEARQDMPQQKDLAEETYRLYEKGEPTLPGGEYVSRLAAVEDALRVYVKQHGSRLLDLYMDSGGVIYIDLGGELKKDFNGDASEEMKLLAGLFRSVAGVIPDISAMKILIDGHEAETIGGHIDISKPLGREIAENI